MDCRVSIPLLFLALLVAPARGALVYPLTEIRVEALPGQSQVEAFFPIENPGPRPARILHVDPACDCTVAKLEKNVLAPGEKTRLAVRFDIGDRAGIQRKVVSVITDEPDAAPRHLFLVVVLPGAIEIQPRFLFWPSSRELEVRRARIFLASHPAIQRLTARCSLPEVEVSLRPIRPGLEYELEVRPKVYRSGLRGVIQLSSEPRIPDPFGHWLVYLRMDEGGGH